MCVETQIGSFRPYCVLAKRGTQAKEESFSVTVKPTAEVVAKFYLATDKSVVAVPIDLKDIPVPVK